MAWPFYEGRNASNILAESYSLITPEKPGIYTFPVVLTFTYDTGKIDPMIERGGKAYYIGQNQIRVCGDDHDVDFMMPGLQTVDTAGAIQGPGITDS